jgi:hypothetical protein
MNGSRRNLNRRRLARRLVAGLALVAYLFTSAGFLPLPVLPHKKKSGTPFPCQDHLCGCSSAKECWTHCCCFSVEERWAWAAAHHVEPPAYAERPAAAGWSLARLRNQADQPACCDHAKHASCCETEEARPAVGTGQSADGTRLPTLLMVTAARCQNLSAAWVGVGAVLPLLPGPARLSDRSPVERLSYPDSSPVILSIVPPDPPPRMS